MTVTMRPRGGRPERKAQRNGWRTGGYTKSNRKPEKPTNAIGCRHWEKCSQVKYFELSNHRKKNSGVSIPDPHRPSPLIHPIMLLLSESDAIAKLFNTARVPGEEIARGCRIAVANFKD